MEDLKRDCYAGKRPGIKKLWYIHADEVENVDFTAVDTVTVTLASSGRWGEIVGKRMTAESTGTDSFHNTVQATLPGWTTEQAVGIGHLTAGRYLVKFLDKAGDTWICGYETPMHLNIARSTPEKPVEYQGITLTFSCDSKFGFLKLQV